MLADIFTFSRFWWHLLSRLFGESDYDAFFRLRKLELGCQEQYKIQGWTNEIKDAMEQLDDEDIAEVTKSMSRGDSKAEKKYNIMFKWDYPEVDYDWFVANRHLLKVLLKKNLLEIVGNSLS